MSDFDISQTYLYKLHMLTNELNKLFDQVLRSKTQLGLSQFLFLLSVEQHQPASHKEIARFLSLTPAAISRQVEVARKAGLVQFNSADDRRAKYLYVTSLGRKETQRGMAVLERDVLPVFNGEDQQADLMSHIDTLLGNIHRIHLK